MKQMNLFSGALALAAVLACGGCDDKIGRASCRERV